MKKLRIIGLLFVALLFMVSVSQAQIVVKVKPKPPKAIVKPPKPGPKHVWIDGHWQWDKQKKDYVWVKGHWTKPQRPGTVWVPGHWNETPKGFKWVPGHWKPLKANPHKKPMLKP